jgi:cyclic pyranopterin phosphate synthase
LLKDQLKELKKAGLTRINISLDTLDHEKYESITRGGNLSFVLDAIDEALKIGMTPLKINVVLIGGFNVDEIKDFVELTRNNPIHVRFIELMPIGEASEWNINKFVSNEVVLTKAKLFPIDREDKGSPATYYKLEGGVGKVGLINPISCSFCDDCNRLRITSDGKIKPCLHSDEEIDLLDTLRNNPKELSEKLLEAVKNKPEKHEINEENYVPILRNMNRIGG